jgi:DNA-binding IclR family transcriptional regulator
MAAHDKNSASLDGGAGAPSPAPGKAGALQRPFAMLEFIVSKGAPVAASEIAEVLNLPKPTVYRMIDSLEAQRLLQRQPGTKRITLGPRLVDLAFDVLRASVQYAPRRMILESVARDCGETCNIGALDGGEIVYLDRVESQHWPLRLQFGVGSRVPLHCTAIGKLFLAFLPNRQRRALMEGLDLRAFTANTLTTRAALEADLGRIRGELLSVDREEYLVGVVCAAAPVFNARGELRAGIAIQAPAARLPTTEASRYRDRLLRAAQELSKSFDF